MALLGPGLKRGRHASTAALISQRFNPLNVSLWRRADSADWADEEMGEGLLNGVRRSRRSQIRLLAKVRVAGSNPVVRSLQTAASGRPSPVPDSPPSPS